MEGVWGEAICLSIKGRWEEHSGKPFWKQSLVFFMVQILHNWNRDYRKEKKTTWINLQVFDLCVLTAGHEAFVLPEKLCICSIAPMVTLCSQNQWKSRWSQVHCVFYLFTSTVQSCEATTYCQSSSFLGINILLALSQTCSLVRSIQNRMYLA